MPLQWSKPSSMMSSVTCLTFWSYLDDIQIFSWDRLPGSQTQIYVCAHPLSTRPFPLVRDRGWRLWYWSRGGAVPTFSLGPQADVGNQELLAVKLVLEEWLIFSPSRGGTPGRRGGPCSLGTLTLRPGSRNIKPDALSCLYSAEDPCMDPEPILPSSCPYTHVWNLVSNKKKSSNGERRGC